MIIRTKPNESYLTLIRKKKPGSLELKATTNPSRFNDITISKLYSSLWLSKNEAKWLIKNLPDFIELNQ